MELNLVESADHICDGVDEFNSQAFTDNSLSIDLVRKTIYWVFDPNTGNYGPSKFVGFADMSLDLYRSAREIRPNGFNGSLTRRAIERVMGLTFNNDDDHTTSLMFWAERVFGVGVLDGIGSDKWMFLSLPLSNNVPTKYFPGKNSPALIKTVGKSQHQDGVRIDEEFHAYFNPPDSKFHVSKGNKRPVSVTFMNRY